MKKQVLGCKELVSDRGDTYYWLTVEDIKKPVQVYKAYGPGSSIDPALLKLSPKGDIYYLKTGQDVKPSAKQVSNDTMATLSVFRAITDLAAAGQVQIFSKKGRYKSEYVEDLGRQMMASIKRIQEGPGVPAVNGDRTGSDRPSAGKSEPGATSSFDGPPPGGPVMPTE